MSNQQDLANTSDLVLLETIIQSVQEIDQPHPAPQSDSYKLDSVVQIPYNGLLPATEVVDYRQVVRDFFSTLPFPKPVILGIAAVIIGALIGILTPWLTTIF